MPTAATLDQALAGPGRDAVPGSRTVRDLRAALDLVRRLGWTITSEVRRAPGIGSWAFVAPRDGAELVLWQHESA